MLNAKDYGLKNYWSIINVVNLSIFVLVMAALMLVILLFGRWLFPEGAALMALPALAFLDILFSVAAVTLALWVLTRS